MRRVMVSHPGENKLPQASSSPDLHAFTLLDLLKPRCHLVVLCFRKPLAFAASRRRLISRHITAVETVWIWLSRLCRRREAPCRPAITAVTSLGVIGWTDTLALLTRHSCCIPPTVVGWTLSAQLARSRLAPTFAREHSSQPQMVRREAAAAVLLVCTRRCQVACPAQQLSAVCWTLTAGGLPTRAPWLVTTSANCQPRDDSSQGSALENRLVLLQFDALRIRLSAYSRKCRACDQDICRAKQRVFIADKR